MTARVHFSIEAKPHQISASLVTHKGTLTHAFIQFEGANTFTQKAFTPTALRMLAAGALQAAGELEDAQKARDLHAGAMENWTKNSGLKVVKP